MAPPKPLIPVQKDMRLYMATLADLFKEPDLDFGSFSIIFDQQTKDPSSLALVRLVYDMPVQMPSRADTPEVRTNQSVPAEEQLHLYTTITRQQAFDLRDVKGGDREKYVYLCQKFGVKLVGRRGLGPAGDALVVAIKWNRAARNEGSTMQKFP
jgi:lysine-specific histone demethylase 1